MAAMGVAARRILARGIGPRVVRAGHVAQPARETVRGLGAQGLPRLAQQLGLALPPIQVRVPSCRQRGVRGLFRSSLPAACGNWERCGWNEPTRPAAAVRGSVASRASAGCGAGPRLSGAVSAGESARACGRAQFRSGASAPGAAGRASGLGRPHARGAHWGGGQRPVPDPARGAGAPTGQSRAGSGAAAAGAGRGAAARAAAAGAVGDLGSLPTSRKWDAGTPDPSTMRSMTTS